MKMNTTMAEPAMAISPLRIESAPSEGPTVRSSRMVTGAGKAPARSTIARSGAPSRDALVDARGRIDGAVQDDGQPPADVLLGDLAEDPRAGRRELDRHLPVAHRVRIGRDLGARQLGAGQQGALLDDVRNLALGLGLLVDLAAVEDF